MMLASGSLLSRMKPEKEPLPVSKIPTDVKPICPFCKSPISRLAFRADGGAETGSLVVVTFVCPSCSSVLGMNLVPADEAKKLKPLG